MSMAACDEDKPFESAGVFDRIMSRTMHFVRNASWSLDIITILTIAWISGLQTHIHFP